MATAHWIGRQRKNHALAASRILKSIPFPRILQPVSRRTHLRSSAMNSPGFCVNGTGVVMPTSPYLPFANSIVPLALSILLVTASTPRGRYWYHVDTPDLEPLHSVLISRHPAWG